MFPGELKKIFTQGSRSAGRLGRIGKGAWTDGRSSSGPIPVDRSRGAAIDNHASGVTEPEGDA
jgi:hypothetical protein